MVIHCLQLAVSDEQNVPVSADATGRAAHLP